MSVVRQCLRAGLAAVLGGLLWSGAVRAQEPGATALEGRVVDGAGAPVAGVVVAVHRVAEGGGAEVARATTGEDGRFTLPLETTEGGIYFAATRYEGALYVGTPFRDLREAPQDYVIVIDERAAITAAGGRVPGPATGAASGRPERESSWPVLALVGLLAGAAVLAPLATRRGRMHAVRTLLHELADLEERAARATSPSEAFEAERAALRTRLRELTRTAS